MRILHLSTKFVPKSDRPKLLPKGWTKLGTPIPISQLVEYSGTALGIIEDGEVVIDLDSDDLFEQFKQITECKHIVKSTRGGHFYFKTSMSIDELKQLGSLASKTSIDIQYKGKGIYLPSNSDEGRKEKQVILWEGDTLSLLSQKDLIFIKGMIVDENMKKGVNVVKKQSKNISGSYNYISDNNVYLVRLFVDEAKITKSNMWESNEIIRKFLNFYNLPVEMPKGSSYDIMLGLGIRLLNDQTIPWELVKECMFAYNRGRRSMKEVLDLIPIEENTYNENFYSNRLVLFDTKQMPVEVFMLNDGRYLIAHSHFNNELSTNILRGKNILREYLISMCRVNPKDIDYSLIPIVKIVRDFSIPSGYNSETSEFNVIKATPKIMAMKGDIEQLALTEDEQELFRLLSPISVKGSKYIKDFYDIDIDTGKIEWKDEVKGLMERSSVRRGVKLCMELLVVIRYMWINKELDDSELSDDDIYLYLIWMLWEKFNLLVEGKTSFTPLITMFKGTEGTGKSFSCKLLTDLFDNVGPRISDGLPSKTQEVDYMLFMDKHSTWSLDYNVILSEVGDWSPMEMKNAVAKIKSFTGSGGVSTVRGMNITSQVFESECKMYITGNSWLKIHTDNAGYRRLMPILLNKTLIKGESFLGLDVEPSVFTQDLTLFYYWVGMYGGIIGKVKGWTHKDFIQLPKVFKNSRAFLDYFAATADVTHLVVEAIRNLAGKDLLYICEHLGVEFPPYVDVKTLKGKKLKEDVKLWKITLGGIKQSFKRRISVEGYESLKDFSDKIVEEYKISSWINGNKVKPLLIFPNKQYRSTEYLKEQLDKMQKD